MPKVHEFPYMSSLTAETKVPAAQRSNAEDPEDLLWTITQLMDFLTANGWIQIQGVYASDAAAATGGVAIGQWYETDYGHEEGIPAGVAKKRLV